MEFKQKKIDRSFTSFGELPVLGMNYSCEDVNFYF